MTISALTDLAPLIGHWRMELHGAAFLPNPEAGVAGEAELAWIEDGAAVAMRQGSAAVWIIGRDEAEDGYHVLYADDRGLSRVYRMELSERRRRIWRTTPTFSQRFEAHIAPDGLSISGRWEKSTDGGAAREHDFNVDYVRL